MSARGGPQLIPRPPGAREGGPPPWAHLAGADRRIGLADVERTFRGRVGAPSVLGSATDSLPSAVLALLWEHEGEVELLFTRRSRGLRNHSGEVSFPGGRSDAGESPAEAALREACEEVALDPAGIDVLGELDHLMTVTSRSFIVPLVALAPGRPEGLRPNPGEVDAILFVTARELLLDEVYREERWTWTVPPPWIGDAEAAAGRADAGAVERSIYFFELVGDTLWGATASMVRQLLGLVLGIPTDIGHD